MNKWYQFLNIFFFVFHTGFTLFNMTGWAFRSLRKWNLITLLLTAFSWFVLGIWHGWGYCFCTDWHYTVRNKLGFYNQHRSYISLLVFELTGKDFDEHLVEMVTLFVFVLSLLLSVILNVRDYRQKRVLRKNG